MVHGTLCDWPLPACMLFTSPFLLFAHVTEDFLLGLESQKPEAKCVPAFWALPWLFALPGTLVPIPFHGCSSSCSMSPRQRGLP